MTSQSRFPVKTISPSHGDDNPPLPQQTLGNFSDVPLHVLLVVEPGRDGVFRHVEGLTQFLHDHHHRVSLAYSSRRGSDGLSQLIAKVLEKGGSAIDLDTGNKPSLSDFSALWKLRALIHKIKPDVIHAHSSKGGALVRMLTSSKPWRPVFYTPNAYYGMGNRNIMAPFYTAVERLLGKRAITITVSEDEATFARKVLKIPKSLIRIIPNPVPTERFLPASAEVRKAARVKLGFPEEAFIVGTIGRLSFQKDPLTATMAMAPLMKKDRSLYFAHLGDGELLPVLEEYAHQEGISAQILRPHYLEDTVPFYQSLDGFLLTSRYEAGIPFVLLEAFSCGLPTVTTIPLGMTQVTHLGLSDCWTAQVGDVAEIAAGLDALITTHVNCFATNHRQCIEEDFSPKVCFGKVVQEYRKSLVKS